MGCLEGVEFRPNLRLQLSDLPLYLVFVFLYGLVIFPLEQSSNRINSLLLVGSADVSGVLGFSCSLV